MSPDNEAHLFPGVSVSYPLTLKKKSVGRVEQLHLLANPLKVKQRLLCVLVSLKSKIFQVCIKTSGLYKDSTVSSTGEQVVFNIIIRPFYFTDFCVFLVVFAHELKYFVTSNSLHIKLGQDP